MALEDWIFEGLLRTAFALCSLLLFGLGFVHALARSPRYTRMGFAGLGFVGLAAGAVAEWLAGMPLAILAAVPRAGVKIVAVAVAARDFLEHTRAWHGAEILEFVCLAALVVGFTGRFRYEPDAVDDEIDRVLGEGP